MAGAVGDVPKPLAGASRRTSMWTSAAAVDEQAAGASVKATAVQFGVDKSVENLGAYAQRWSQPRRDVVWYGWLSHPVLSV